MSIRMIIMDMDGTLLNKDGKISPRTKTALIEAEKKGVRLVLASGRSYKTLTAFGEELEMPKYDGYFIGVNGAAITETKTMKNTTIRQLQPTEIQEIFDVAAPYEVEMMGVMDATIYHYLPESLRKIKEEYRKENQIADDVPWTAGVFAMIVDQRKGYSAIHSIHDASEIKEAVNKVTMAHLPEKLEPVYNACMQQLSHQYNFVRTSPQWIECSPKDVSKGNAIRKLQAELNITPEETLIFGDGENDLSMFDCGYAIAMGNAMDSVKLQAKETTADNNSDGIALVVEEKVLGGK